MNGSVWTHEYNIHPFIRLLNREKLTLVKIQCQPFKLRRRFVVLTPDVFRYWRLALVRLIIEYDKKVSSPNLRCHINWIEHSIIFMLKCKRKLPNEEWFHRQIKIFFTADVIMANGIGIIQLYSDLRITETCHGLNAVTFHAVDIPDYCNSIYLNAFCISRNLRIL